ncbi:hypothetical protein H4R19_002281 [Coemansia spiralis]|nr:hypothetical protein H4R19_002281 [Coemansia spiralis]
MADCRVLSGIVHLWSFRCADTPPPTELAGVQIQPAAPKATDPPTWFQGHIFPSQQRGEQQHALLGVPAAQPPHIHGCMVSEHDRPMYYDVYIADYAAGSVAIAGKATNVARSSGSGDAVELTLDSSTETATLAGSAPRVHELRLSTTRLLSGDRATHHLQKYAPDALALYNHDTTDIVVCLGVISMTFAPGQ